MGVSTNCSAQEAEQQDGPKKMRRKEKKSKPEKSAPQIPRQETRIECSCQSLPRRQSANPQNSSLRIVFGGNSSAPMEIGPVFSNGLDIRRDRH